RPITRFVVAGGSAEGLVPPGALSYPVRTRNLPSTERVISPSAVDVPEAVRARFPPLAAIGILMVWTNVPAVVYSSTKTVVAALVNGAEPSPTRYKTTSPFVNGTGGTVGDGLATGDGLTDGEG